jgi:hypothetical protein
VARVETAPDEVELPQNQTRLRVVTGLAALVLVVAAAVLVTRHDRVRPSVPEYCAQMRAARGLTTVMATGDAAQITRAVTQLDHAVKVAPASVVSPTRVLVAYADGLVSALHAGGDTESALAAAVRRQEPQIPRVEAAGRQVSAWVKANCGFTLAG